MKEDIIKNAVEKLKLEDEAREKIKNECRRYAETVFLAQAAMRRRSIVRVLVAAALIAIMTVSVFAASRLIGFSLTRDGDEIKINASLPEENKDTDAPLRSWNSEEGEISVRLVFEFMPEDMSEDTTATHKYGGAQNNRAITFSGYDLRRSDLNAIIGNVDTAEKFTAGDKEAYLFVSQSASIYNKDLYVLFAEEDMVVHASVGYGISVDEIKAIAEGMCIMVTDDVNIALPISNQLNPGGENDIPFVITLTYDPVYRADLLAMGERGYYENPFGSYTVKVDKVEIFDSVKGFGSGLINEDFVRKFMGEDGEPITYKRTEMIYSGDEANGEKIRSSFGETIEMRKRFVCVTVTVDSTEAKEDVKPFLHTFSLGGLVETEDGSIERTQGHQNFVVDSTPGDHADKHDPIYRMDIGGGQWVLGYLLDAEECEGELYFYSREAELHYVIK